MSGENTKTDLLAGSEAQPVEPVVKVKGFLVGLVNGVPSVAIGTRSEHEQTRPGDADVIGGKRRPPSEDPKQPIETADETFIRETGEELNGVTPELITHIDTVERIKDGVPTTTIIVAARARVERSGARIGTNEDGLKEHTEIRWVPLDAIQDEETLPKKYRRAAASETGRLALDCLAELAYEVPGLQEESDMHEQLPQPQHAELALVGI